MSLLSGINLNTNNSFGIINTPINCLNIPMAGNFSAENNLFNFKIDPNNFKLFNFDFNFGKDFIKASKPNTEISVGNISYSKYGSNGNKIKELSPEMQVKTAKLLDYAKTMGMKVTITSGFRTQEQQKRLLRTRAKYAAKNSLHCLGRAIDINIAGGKDSDYRMLANYAKSIGMRWGGDFKKVAERWHFDIGRA